MPQESLTAGMFSAIAVAVYLVRAPNAPLNAALAKGGSGRTR